MQIEYAQTYRTLWERHWWWRSREAYLLAALERLHRRAGGRSLRIIDIGCGDGLFFDRLARFGTVDGLEADARFCAEASRGGSMIRGALGGGFAPGPVYDLVLMLDVLEHIADEAAALGEARAALRPEGRLLVTVPALAWLWSRHDVVNEHQRRYDRRRLCEVLGRAGFVVEQVRYFFAWTVGPMLLRRWLNPGSGDGDRRRVRADYAVTIPPAPLNRALTAISRAEHAVGRFVPWPIGSSLMAVARVER